MKDLLLRARVVVRTSILKISRRRSADYVKKLHQKCAARAARLFFRVRPITLGSLSMQRFWTTDGSQKCAVFLFNLSSHYHIFIVKSLFTYRDV